VHVSEVLDVVFRWAHLIAGIMWIGNSMLFNWLDRNLVPPPRDEAHELSQGTIHVVHSGAFYEIEKKLLRPGEMPAQLHWFKWQNGITWLTGMSLLVVVYFMNGAAFLVDPSVRALSPAAAIAISLGSLVVGWVVYDGLWRVLGNRPRLAGAVLIALLFAAAYGFTLVFSGRAAYIETGVLMGTMMTGNVWMVIIPSQRELIAATKAGREQDKALSLRAKQRSIHNNYLTFPLLFIMLSNHFPSTYGSHLNWLILFAVMVGGAGVRHFMNVRYDVPRRPWLAPALAVGAASLAAMVILTHISTPPAFAVKGDVDFAQAQDIMVHRCIPCHSAKPADALFPVAPANVVFDTAERIQAMAPRIKDRAVVNKTMPFLNRTGMTEEERAQLGKWIDSGAKLK
jgi:uncharacterized membrane protein